MARVTRTGIEDRRNYTPPGRLRRIAHDHRLSVVALLLGVLIAAGLFVASSAMAVDARLDRRVAEMVARRDEQSLEFVRQKESQLTEQVVSRERTLAAKEEELAPSNKPYLVVSLAEHRVLYIQGNDTIFRAPVAIGSGETIVIDGVTKRFQTPRGKMTITSKELDPVWVPPNWHYVQIARKNGLGIVDMSDAPPNALNGRFPPGQVPISGGNVIIPPWGSPQRQMKGTLGAA
ncbi:MAG: L,D-transpeptidase, partial [Gemmatimonadetes bacterium]|nr:L,D-transpeptidase [Gemmatimonadota bacterium]